MPAAYVHALRFRWLNRFYDPPARLLTREKHVKNALLERFSQTPCGSVLDLGCGSGTLALMIASRWRNTEVHGLDGDAEMLARAARKALRSGAGIHWYCADARRMPVPDHRFDCLVSSLFFHHLDRQAKAVALAECMRVLEPGGHLLIADWGPAADALQWLLAWPVRWFDGLAVTRDNFRGCLPAMLVRAGFTGIREFGRVRTPIGTICMIDARAPE